MDTVAATRAFGKLIILGEHFVVYQVPALVGAVADYTDCAIENQSDPNAPLQVVDNRPAVPNYKVKKADEAAKAIDLVLNHMKISGSGLKLSFGGNLTCASGIGASAAQVVALARALAQHQGKKLSLEEINAAGYEGEKGYHGTPSGIDNTAATYGGVLRFTRTDNPGQPEVVFKKLNQPLRIVYASTGITSSTTEVVDDVRSKREADPAWFASLLSQYTALIPRAESAMEKQDWVTLGTLMNENHTLCQQLTVSCAELDSLVLAAREAGAVGAKMSGTGRGGLMLALTPTEDIQNRVAEALEKSGAAQVWKTALA